MITIKTEKDIVLLREGGKRLARILASVAAEVRPGISTAALNDLADKLIAEGSAVDDIADTSAFLGYKPKGAPRAYPAALCVSINDEVVHGIPNESPRIITEGDVVSLDLGLVHGGLITDHAVTVGAGTLTAEAQKLLAVTKQALVVGIAAAQAGKKTGDIGWAIQEYVRSHVVEKTGTKHSQYGIVEELAGHGVGYAVHEDPFVPNFGKPNQGASLKPGMVIAIEPMLTLGGPDITIDQDGYTVLTADGSLAAHFEHTVLITEAGPEILTVVT